MKTMLTSQLKRRIKALRFAVIGMLMASTGLTACQPEIEAALPPDEPVSEHAQVQAAEQAPPSPAPTPQTPRVKQTSAQPVAIKLTGEQPFFPVRKCMNVANALEAPREGEWGYKVRVEELRAIASAGFDTIRLPVRWDSHMQAKPPYAVSGVYMARIKQVVSQAQREGLGVILDVHHYEDLIENPRGEEARFLALWEQIATTFQNAPNTIYFEVLNEPTNAMSMRELNRLYTKVLPIIRKSNPSRTVIIGGNSWNSVDTMDAIAWPNDKNLVATFHDYGPHEFTHQGAQWTSDDWPLGRTWGGRGDRAELADTYDIAARFQAKRNVPVLVGEFGVIDRVPLDQRTQWVKTRRQYMEAAGYSWCAWDLTGAFKSYDVDGRKWLPGMLDAYFGD